MWCFLHWCLCPPRLYETVIYYFYDYNLQQKENTLNVNVKCLLLKNKYPKDYQWTKKSTFTNNLSSLYNTVYHLPELDLISFNIMRFLSSVFILSMLTAQLYWYISELASSNNWIYWPTTVRKSSSMLIMPKLTHHFW